MKHRSMMLACVLMLGLVGLVPEVAAQAQPSAEASPQVRVTHEEPLQVARYRRRHCHLVRGHYVRRHGRRVYVRAHRHCHHATRPVA